MYKSTNKGSTISANIKKVSRGLSAHPKLSCLFLLCVFAAGAFAVWQKQVPPTASTTNKPGFNAQSFPTPVLVTSVRKGDMSLYLTALGAVTPLNAVTVRSRVDGQLMQVHFREGQDVRQGSLLANIDPRPFEVQLTQAEGQMARDRELLHNARLDVERYRKLWKQDAIARQQLDTQEALVRQYEAAVKIDQGQRDSAQLQLSYSRITAPISGRVGLRLVDAGNMIHASDASGILTITQMQPMTVVFSIPEDSLPQLLSIMKAGRVQVEVFDRAMQHQLASGELLSLDNQIDPSTGTIKLKAIFANQDSRLFPQQFVNVRLLLAVKQDALIVPTVAVQKSPQGSFVFVVHEAENTVSMQAVKTDIVQGGEASIIEGLQGNEQVVVDGAERLREGSKIEIKGQKDKPAQ